MNELSRLNKGHSLSDMYEKKRKKEDIKIINIFLL